MRVLWDKFLQKINGMEKRPVHVNLLYHCPKHPTFCQRTFKIVPDPVWNYKFHCSHCNFTGTAVDWLCNVRNISLDEALSAFDENGEFYETRASKSPSDLIEYRNYHSRQVTIDEYIKQCRNMLLKTVPGLTTLDLLMRTYGLHTNSQYIPQTMGLVTPKSAPDSLHKLQHVRYLKNNYLIYKYTKNQQLAALVLQNIFVSAGISAAYGEPDGVFLESNIKSVDQFAVLTANPLAAAVMHSKHAGRSATTFPVISAASLPLPNTMTHVKKLYLLSTEDHPFTLLTTVKFLNETILEHKENLELFILDIHRPLSKIDADKYTDLLQQKQPLHSWCADQLIRQFDTIPENQLFDMFVELKLTDVAREKLIDAIQEKGGSSVICDLLIAAGAHNLDTAYLPSSRRKLELTRNGIFVYIAHQAIQITNLCIIVNKKIIASDIITYDCSIQHSSYPQRTFSIQFKNSECTTSKLKRKIQLLLLKNGINSPIYFKTLPGLSWDEVFDTLSRTKPIETELTKLGFNNEDNKVYFPNFVYDIGTKALSPQTRYKNITNEALTVYSGLKPDLDITELNLSVYKMLWECPDPFATAYAVGIAHVLHQILISIVCNANGWVFSPKHLCYADISVKTWKKLFEQLVTLFSGNAFIPKIPSQAIKRFLKPYLPLNTLPRFAYLPRFATKQMKSWIHNLDFPLVTLCTEVESSGLNSDDGVAFVAPESAGELEPRQLNENVVKKLQQTFPYFLQEVLAYNWPKSILRNLYRTPMPARTLFDEIRTILSAKENETVYLITSPYHALHAYNSVEDFLYALGRIIKNVNRDRYIQFKYSYPGKTGRETPTVFISRTFTGIETSAVSAANSFLHHNAFNVDTLNKQFEKSNYLVKTDVHYPNMWLVSRDVWDTFVPETIESASEKIIDFKQAAEAM